MLPLAAAAQTAPPQPESIWQAGTLGGDWGGVRTSLTDHGIAFTLADMEDLEDDASGGVRRGTGSSGASLLAVAINLETLIGWQDASIGFVGGDLRGHGISQFDTRNLLTVSSIESQPQLRLFDFYIEQDLFDQQLTLRGGQINPADDFMSSHYAASLINSSFAWPVLLGADLPGDDPASVIASPGLFAKYDGGGPVSGQVGVYKGSNSSTAGPLEARQSTSNGDGVLVFVEGTYSIRPSADGTLPAVFKAGAWYHSATFDDLATDQSGDSLAFSDAEPRRHSGDYGWYGAIDKLWYAVPDTSDQGLGSFVRVAGAPDDRNLISFYVDAGLDFKGPFAGRGDDHMALGFAWARASSAAEAYDRNIRLQNGPDYPIRDREAVVELTYQAAVTKWWTVQPDLQYVVSPGLGAPDPNQVPAAERTPNAVALLLRSVIKF